jgi:glycosyltransferase involved in cell wall biosynthesis
LAQFPRVFLEGTSVNLLALTEGPGHVCYRYRLEAFAQTLAKAGWNVEAVALARGGLRRAGQLRRAGEADVVVMQRKLLPLWQLCLLRKHAKRLVYDVDDALFCRDSFHPKGTASWQRMMSFWATVYAADVITCGNRHLCAEVARFTPGERVHYFPTCVRPESYRLATHSRQGPTTKLVWIGQRSTLPSLEAASVGLAAAAARLPGLSLRVVSDVFPSVETVRIERCPWSAATEADDLAQADIGLSWLPADDWSLGKCGLKVLQYMAAGLPVIANPVGVHGQMIVDGVSGFLVHSAAEFAEAVARLAADPPLRAQMGRAGRELVEREFSVRRWQREWPALCDELADTGIRASASTRGVHWPGKAGVDSNRSFVESAA